jgi:hypothetical protein
VYSYPNTSFTYSYANTNSGADAFADALRSSDRGFMPVAGDFR